MVVQLGAFVPHRVGALFEQAQGPAEWLTRYRRRAAIGTPVIA
jgi:hypothetical protein